jgi:hypothetical protein
MLESMDSAAWKILLRVASCTTKYYSKHYWKRIGGKDYPLAELDEAGLLLTRPQSRSAASGTPTYSACGCH